MPFLEIKVGAQAAYAVRPHSHERLSIGFVESGSSHIMCRRLAFHLDCHDIVLIPPGVIHLCEPQHPEQFTFRMLYIDLDWFQNVFEIEPKKLLPAAAHLNIADRNRKADFFRLVENPSSDSDSISPEPLAAEEFVIEFFGYLFSKGLGIRLAETELRVYLRKIDPARELMDAHPTDDIRLADLAGACQLSPFTLIKQFRKSFGLTPHAYLINRRINLAKQFLRQGHSVAATAVSSGFFDQSHFVKTFRNYTGLTPTQFH